MTRDCENPHAYDARPMYGSARKLVKVAISADAYRAIERFARRRRQRPEDLIRALLERYAQRVKNADPR